MATQIVMRVDTAANWTADNPTLAAGEFGVELPATLGAGAQFKIGDGSTVWNSLPYGGGTGGGGGGISGTFYLPNDQTVSANATLGSSIDVALITGAYTLTLTSPTTTGETVYVKNTSTTATVTVAPPASGTIDGSTTSMSLPPLTSTILWCSSNSGPGEWFVMSFSAPPANVTPPVIS